MFKNVPTIWSMEGLSSQRNLIIGIKKWIQAQSDTNIYCQKQLNVIASHHAHRPEITGIADIALTEPDNEQQKLAFIEKTVAEYPLQFIHVGRHCHWFEANRTTIENYGVSLITGALSTTSFRLAEDKFAFTQLLQTNHLPAIPAIYVDTYQQLVTATEKTKQIYGSVCLKPNTGIYGEGFWILTDANAHEKGFFSPETRQINTALYLNIIKQRQEPQKPWLVMPYLPGIECSIDLVVNKGNIIAAVGRRKINGTQELFVEGEEIQLATRCCALLHADGLVNVQTRQDVTGKTHVLEANLRPSGGFGYSLPAGVNLAAVLFADRYNCPLPINQFIETTIKVLDQPITLN